MGNSENLLKFEEALRNDPEKKKKYDEILKRIVEEKSVKNDGEAVVKAAGELGFDVSQEEVEHSLFEKQEVEEDELDRVAGGKWCPGKNYECVLVYKHPGCSNNSTCTVNERITGACPQDSGYFVNFD